MCDMTHSHVCHDPFICVTLLIHMCTMTYSCVPWLRRAGVKGHRYTCICAAQFVLSHYDALRLVIASNDLFLCATWLMTRQQWLILMCNMTHDSSTCVTHIHVCDIIPMCHMTHHKYTHASQIHTRVTNTHKHNDWFVCTTWVMTPGYVNKYVTWLGASDSKRAVGSMCVTWLQVRNMNPKWRGWM